MSDSGCWCDGIETVEPLVTTVSTSPVRCSDCDPLGWRRALATSGVLRCHVTPAAAAPTITWRALNPLGVPERRVDAPFHTVDRRLLVEADAAVHRGDMTFHADEAHRQGPARFTALACARAGQRTGTRFIATAVEQESADIDQLATVVGFHEKLYRSGQGRQRASRIRRALHPVVIQHDAVEARFFYPSPLTLRAVSSPAAVPTLRRVWRDLCRDESRHATHWWQPGDLLVWDNLAVVHRSVTQLQRGDRLMYRTFTAGHHCDALYCLGSDGMTPIRLSAYRCP